MRRLTQLVLWISAALLLFLSAGFIYVWAVEWKPAPEETIHDGGGEISVLPDTLIVLTWNTGYAGLGDDMDFFMDGGKRTRTSHVRTEENLRRITEFLTSCEADVILLQEVDRRSHRSYGIDQMAVYRENLPDYHGYFAFNYKSAFVPVPLRSPLGRVESGIALFSRQQPETVVRHRYESEFPFPERLFNLKRCWLSAGFHTSSGRPITVAATHNSAYDSGGMRQGEMIQLYGQIGRDAVVIGGDWNQFPPGYAPSAEETENPYFSPQQMVPDDRFCYFYNDSVSSVRYLYEALSAGTTRSTIDFFMVSDGIRCLRVETIDLGFRNSDHNPVLATFLIAPD